jgi:hypothetical protein
MINNQIYGEKITFCEGRYMNKNRKEEIEKLNAEQRTIDYLNSLTDEEYQETYEKMKLLKQLELQVLSEEEVKELKFICTIYANEGMKQVSHKSYLYGKIQGKKEERIRRN